MENKLTIYKKGTASEVRCEVNKWEFQDKAMGEQYLMFTISSPVPIPFCVGDWCEFRGQTYTLNVEPSCTQKARPSTHGEAFTYESVKFDSPQDDLTRCMILDVIPTSGEHSAAYGTNYTGSANFTLNCFETTFEYQGNTIYYAPVHALLDRIKANLDRLYPGDPQNPDTCWQIYIDDSKCHSDDKIITFANWTAAQALAEVHNTFKLDYVVRGRKIIVGDVSSLISTHPELEGIVAYVTDLTEQGQPEFFGYGMGYLSESNQGKSLFQIKKLSKSDQQIVTRLRAVGSTKNMPYRYYHTHYTLPQTMYVQNLQLPDTFVPYDRDEDYPDNVDAPHCKVDGNETRDGVYGEGVLRHVLGKSNDAYIDKNDDAASCPEGIREAVARWDGSDGELPEIYPTIEEATYGELRAAGVPDMDGNVANMEVSEGANAFPNYGKNERIDEILEPGEHCNEGNGVMTESEAFGMTTVTVPVHEETITTGFEDGTQVINFFNIATTQEPGDYILSFTTQEPQVFIELNKTGMTGNFRARADVTLMVSLYQTPIDGSAETLLGTYSQNKTISRTGGSYGRSSESLAKFVMNVPDFHDIEDGWSMEKLTVTKQSTIRATASILVSTYTPEGDFSASSYGFTMGVRGSDQTDNVNPEAQWGPSSAGLYYSSTPFHLRIKDIGVDFMALNSVDGGDIIISMKSGQCAGREFVVKPGSISTFQQDGTGKKGWDLELDRVNDDSIHAYFPSTANQIKAGDQYVLLNIALPDAYIKAAEVRLLTAATNHLVDNCDTQYTYQPSVDDIYLQRNIDFHANDPENSVFWRLYAGMKFPFYGIPREDGDPLPVADITIESVSIRMGERPTPQVDITLNDKLQQTTMQRLQTSVDRLYGSVFSHGGVVYSSSNAVSDAVVRDFGKNYFLSKLDDDTAEGNLTFLGDIDAQALTKIMNAYVAGTIGTKSFEDSFGGEGWKINSANNSMTLDELTVRKTMRVFEMMIQKIRATGGEIVVSPANGKVKAVSETSTQYIVTLESDGDGGFGNMFQPLDFVRCQRWNRDNSTVHYYWVSVTDVEGETIKLPKSEFATGVSPAVGDELVLFGSRASTNRQGVITISATENGKPRITVYNNVFTRSLDGCARVILGDLNGVSDATLNPEGYGLYSDNVYLKGEFHLVNEGGTEVSIGDEMASIKSGEIILDAAKTIVPNNFEVGRLKTIPTNSEAYVYIHDSLIEIFGSNGFRNISFGVNENGYAVLQYYDNNGNMLYDLGPEGLRYSDASAAGYTSKTYAHGIGGSGATVYLFTAKRQVGVIVADGVYASTKETAEAADGKWFTIEAQPIQLNGSGEPTSTVTARTYWNEEISYNENVAVKNSTVDEVKQYFRDEYGATEAQINAITWNGAVNEDLGQWKFAEGYDVTITFRSSFYKGNKTDKYNFEQ